MKWSLLLFYIPIHLPLEIPQLVPTPRGWGLCGVWTVKFPLCLCVRALYLTFVFSDAATCWCMLLSACVTMHCVL